MGLNCGVRLQPSHKKRLPIATTWAPRYIQPRIDPVTMKGFPTRYADLANPDFDHRALLRLPEEYDRWIGERIWWMLAMVFRILEAPDRLRNESVRAVTHRDQQRRAFFPRAAMSVSILRMCPSVAFLPSVEIR